MYTVVGVGVWPDGVGEAVGWSAGGGVALGVTDRFGVGEIILNSAETCWPVAVDSALTRTVLKFAQPILACRINEAIKVPVLAI